VEALQGLLQLWIANHRRLRSPRGPSGSRGHDLALTAGASPLVEAGFAELATALENRVPQVRHAKALWRGDLNQQWRPIGIDAQREAKLAAERVDSGQVAFGQRNDVGNLHHPGLDRLHAVATARLQGEHDNIGEIRDADVRLPRADRLHEHDIEASDVQHSRGERRRLGNAPEASAAAHRPEEHTVVGVVLDQSDSIAEHGPMGEGAGRIDRDDADGQTETADVLHESADQSGLPNPGGTGDPHHRRLPDVRPDCRNERSGRGIIILDPRDRTRDRTAIAGARQRRQFARISSQWRHRRYGSGQATATTDYAVGVSMDIPIFPLELVLVPGEPLPLHIFEPRYQEMVARCVDGDEPFTLVLSDDDGMRDVGCTAEITEVLEKFPDGRSNIVVTGRDVVRVDEVHDAHNYRSAVVSPIDDDPDEATADAQQAAITAYTAVSAELPGQAPSAPEPGPRLSYALVARVDLGLDVKQSLLENRDEQRRLEVVTELLVDIHRGLVLTRETQERARKNGRVRTPEELAVELGLDE